MKKTSILFILIALIVVGFFIWWQNGNAAVSAKDTSSKVFVIPKGAAVRAIGNDLKEQGLIRDPVIYFLYIKKNGLEKSIQAGSYKLSPSMSLSEVVNTMLIGSIDIWITIPEGYRSEQIGEVLAENLETYDESWTQSLRNEEGFLFPDTYLVPKDADVETIINIMKNTFSSKLESEGLDPARNDISDIVTIASLIEREAITDEEKPMIAGVLYNRIGIGMALQVDATIQYAKGSTGSWWEPVTLAEYRSVISNYNTYLNPGLPPGPIANPGIESIKAAANPAQNSYFYYIHDTSGQVHFAETLEGHNSNINRYLN